jgi:hypothetical protein
MKSTSHNAVQHDWTNHIKLEGPMNETAIGIAHSPIQHDRTKHILVVRHFIKEKLDSGLICKQENNRKEPE